MSVATLRTMAVALCLGAVTASFVLRTDAIDGGPASCSDGFVSRVYAGRSTPTGAVTQAQWRAFVTEAVTPRFPGGFTELQAHGHWRDHRGSVIEEDTRIIEIVHDGTPRHRQNVRAVASEYKSRFAQQSVLITQAPLSHCS